MRIGKKRIPAAQGFADTVNAGLRRQLSLIRAQQPIPQDENAAKISVDIRIVDRMVYTMIHWRHKNLLRPAQCLDKSGMHPELIDQIQRPYGHDHFRRKTGKQHGQVEYRTDQETIKRLTQRRRQIVFFALMVHHVNAPQHVDRMLAAVTPVVTKIIDHKRCDPQPGRHAQFAVRQQRPQHGIGQKPHKPCGKTHRLAEHAGAQRRNGIIKPVITGLASDVHSQLDKQQHHEHRNGIENKIHIAPVFTTNYSSSRYRNQRLPDVLLVLLMSGNPSETKRRTINALDSAVTLDKPVGRTLLLAAVDAVRLS